ncbi:MAG TPA: hypothetical protein PLK76_00895 [bacterium]|nr:hypothetical protein [bacterium]
MSRNRGSGLGILVVEEKSAGLNPWDPRFKSLIGMAGGDDR